MMASMERGGESNTNEMLGMRVQRAKTFEELTGLREEIQEKSAGKPLGGTELTIFERDMHMVGQKLVKLAAEKMQTAATPEEIDNIRIQALESFGNDAGLLGEHGLLREEGDGLDRWTKFYKEQLEQK